jgi:hypothetical protein
VLRGVEEEGTCESAMGTKRSTRMVVRRAPLASC